MRSPALPDPAGGGRRPTILLVEDNEDIRDLLEQVLSGEGYQVLVAQDAHEALQISRAYPSAIDLLIADIILPGMDGYTIAESITFGRPDTQVLFLTGDPSILDSVQRQEAAFHWVFLQKPFSPREAIERVRELIGTPPAGG